MSLILTMLMTCVRLPLPGSAPLMRPRLLVFVGADNGSPFSYFSNFLYLVLVGSNDKRRTIIIHTVLAMSMFSSLEPRT